MAQKFSLEDVRDYLENTGAIREAEILISGYGNLPGRFSSFSTATAAKKKDNLGNPNFTSNLTQLNPKLSQLNPNPALVLPEKTLPEALGETLAPGTFGAIRGNENVKELQDFEEKLKSQKKDREDRQVTTLAFYSY